MDEDLPTQVDMDAMPPAIGPYKVEKILGVGGMAIVYQVMSENGKMYALKIINYKDALDPENWNRFSREIDVLSKLDHPNIIRIYDVGDWQNRPYFVMDYVDGLSLDRYLAEKGRISEKEALPIIWKIALALVSVHKLDILHRDIKPSNIMLEDKKPYLMDFGIGCYYSGGSRITRTGTIVGTPNYMPPEQAQGEWDEMGPWSDIYALGLTLYHLLTGVLPFKAKSDVEVIINLTTKTLRPPSKYNPSLASDVDMVVQKAIEKKPKDRYQDAEEFASALRALIHGQKVVVKTRTSKIKTKKSERPIANAPWLLPGIVTLVVLVILISLKLFSPAPARTESGKKNTQHSAKNTNKPLTDQSPNSNKQPNKPPDTTAVIPNDIQPPEVKPDQWPKENLSSFIVPPDWPLFPSDDVLTLVEMPHISQQLLELERKLRGNEDKKQYVEILLQEVELYRQRHWYRGGIETLQKIHRKPCDVVWQIVDLAVQARMPVHAKFYLEYLRIQFPKHPYQEKFLQLSREAEQQLENLQTFPQVRKAVCVLFLDLQWAYLSGLEGNPQVRTMYLAHALQISENNNIREFTPWIRVMRSLDGIACSDFKSAQRELQLVNNEAALPNAIREYIFFANAMWYFMQDNQRAQAEVLFSQVQRAERDTVNWSRFYLQELKKPSFQFDREKFNRHIDEHIGMVFGGMIGHYLVQVEALKRQGRDFQVLQILTELLCTENKWYHLVHYKLGVLLASRLPLPDKKLHIDYIRCVTFHQTQARMLFPNFSDPIFYLGQIAYTLRDRERTTKYFEYCQKYPPQWNKEAAAIIRQYFENK